METREIQLDAGTVRYREAGAGPPLVFVHGYLVDGRLWDGVVDRLGDRFRCIAPDWPIGAQRSAMNPDADLTPPGVAATIADLLAKLELEDVTIVGNDSGGAMSQILVTRHPERIAVAARAFRPFTRKPLPRELIHSWMERCEPTPRSNATSRR